MGQLLRFVTLSLLLLHVPPLAAQVTVTYVANEGFLLEGGEQKVLVDALFDEGIRGYPRIPAELRPALEEARPPFDDVDLILVTHEHADHFGPRAVTRHLRANPRTRLVSTAAVVSRLRAAIGEDPGVTNRIEAIHLPSEGSMSLERSGVSIRSLDMHHGRNRPVRNLGFLIEIGGMNVLHVGDTEATLEDLRPHDLPDVRIDVALLPSWLLVYDHWIEGVRAAIRPRAIVAMHVPERDAPPSFFGRHGSYEERVRLMREHFPSVVLMETPGQTRTFHPDRSRDVAAHVRAPVKVFLIAGQSNMEGKGAVDTLAWLGEDPEHGHLIDRIRAGDGSWVERDDVWIEFLGRRGHLQTGYGSTGGPHAPRIGPEYGFGIVVGDHYEEPVLLVKTAWGGKDVANDFRAPGSAGGPGPYYTKMIDGLTSVLSRLDEHFPEAEGRGYELAGFVWFQGWNDMVNDEKTAAYTQNLAQMIRDVRTDLGAPRLPVVIGELGVDGDRAKGRIPAFRAAQRAVAEIPEFAGTVRFVRTAPYYDRVAHELFEQDVWKGPEKERFYRIASDRPYHYLGSGKTYLLMGWAFGEAMVDLVEQTSGAAAASAP